jgi:hypothetical protein
MTPVAEILALTSRSAAGSCGRRKAPARPAHQGEYPRAVLIDEAVAGQRLGEVSATVHCRSGLSSSSLSAGLQISEGRLTARPREV